MSLSPTYCRTWPEASVLTGVAEYGRRDIRLHVSEGWQATLLDALQTILDAIEALASYA